MKTEEIETKILKKYRSVSRFSVLSGIPYKRVSDALGGNVDILHDVAEAIKRTDDEPLDHEVGPELVKKIKDKLHGKDLKRWCIDNGVYHYWLKNFVLTGLVRFKSRRVKRLLEILHIGK